MNIYTQWENFKRSSGGNWAPRTSRWFVIIYVRRLPTSRLWETSYGFTPRRKSQIMSKGHLSISFCPDISCWTVVVLQLRVKTLVVFDGCWMQIWWGNGGRRPQDLMAPGVPAGRQLAWFKTTSLQVSSTHFTINFNEQRPFDPL